MCKCNRCWRRPVSVDDFVMSGRDLSDTLGDESLTTNPYSTTFNVMDEALLSFWRHPYLRLLVVVALAVLDFVMFVEDPCSFAQTQASLPVVGDLYNLTLHGWPADLLGRGLKVMLLLVGLPVSFIFGRFVLHHWLFRNRLGLKMFSENNGTVLAELIGLCLGTKVVTWCWALLVRILYKTSVAEDYVATAELGITEEHLAYLLQILCAAGDTITLVMLLDSMLQDESQFKTWQRSLRASWAQSSVRLTASWLLMTGLFAIEVLLITVFGDWDVAFLESERSRSFVAALIFMLDLFTVCQDWEFPFFDNPLEIKLVGWTSPDVNLGCSVCSCSGKWMNYGPMVAVMFLDLNNLCNQWRYGAVDAPLFYGQYLGRSGEIWSITNATLAEHLRHLYLSNATHYDVEKHRGLCINALPYSIFMNGHPDNNTYPPCLPGDRELHGSFWSLNVWDLLLPILPVLLAALIFAFSAHHIPRMPSEHFRRRLAQLSLQDDSTVSLLTSEVEMPDLEYVQLQSGYAL